MRDYEITIIIDPNEDTVKQTKERVKEYINSYKGNITEENDPGIRTLGYEIKDKKQGYYHQITVNLDPSKVSELEREFKLDENILKYFTMVLNK